MPTRPALQQGSVNLSRAELVLQSKYLPQFLQDPPRTMSRRAARVRLCWQIPPQVRQADLVLRRRPVHVGPIAITDQDLGRPRLRRRGGASSAATAGGAGRPNTASHAARLRASRIG